MRSIREMQGVVDETQPSVGRSGIAAHHPDH
jgi:hypothetical protein